MPRNKTLFELTLDKINELTLQSQISELPLSDVVKQHVQKNYYQHLDDSKDLFDKYLKNLKSKYEGYFRKSCYVENNLIKKINQKRGKAENGLYDKEYFLSLVNNFRLKHFGRL